ncbi:MAG: hypothetical protein ACT4PZ_08460 [Panacagrimonas sp.]
MAGKFGVRLDRAADCHVARSEARCEVKPGDGLFPKPAPAVLPGYRGPGSGRPPYRERGPGEACRVCDFFETEQPSRDDPFGYCRFDEAVGQRSLLTTTSMRRVPANHWCENFQWMKRNEA